ncbi:polyprenyl synthetase family protein [Propionicicella superfundia]|uniref:polyprenyl synthetase family protein n=1 Tax=Propionicicella superfundia TaxID=348582 RepID=UPI000418C9CE|nr:polyprenyl synthetase family protein [Propionicicella superfundia]
MVTFRAEDPLSASFRAAVAAAIDEFLTLAGDRLAAIGPELGVQTGLAREFTRGGKRMRPAFCCWGYIATAGVPDDPAPLVRAAASLDLLHVSALVHDDLMDGSDTRRGLPAAHRQFASLHGHRGWRGRPDAFGAAAAILLGDLLLVWSEEMFATAGLPTEAAARAGTYLNAVRTEVACGQYLDVVAAAQPLADPGRPSGWAIEEAHRVVEYKTARYTVQRPLQIGAAIAGAHDALQASLAAYGSALGRAFQFRDDLLGVYGDEVVTGKPAGDDLREGKLTVLIAHTLAAVDDVERRRLDRLLGDPSLTDDQIDGLRNLIADCGARAAVEAEISRSADAARLSLAAADLTIEGRVALERLVDLATTRES